MADAAPVYDSAEETLKEEMQRNRAAAAASGRPNGSRLRVIRRRGNEAAGPAGPVQAAALPPASGTPYARNHAEVSPQAAPRHQPQQQASHPPHQHGRPGKLGDPGGGRPFAAHASPAGAPQRMPMFPSTLFWADKLQTLGAVYLVAEALVRSMLMESEEFADRVAWIALERLVRDLTALRSSGGAEGTLAEPASATRAAVLVDVRRMLGVIRASHAAFHTAVDNTLVHGAILILLRVTHLASLSTEFAEAPYAHTLSRHIQELVFLCDFAGMVLSTVTLSDGPHHEPLSDPRPDAPAIWLPAHYANEASVRALAPLDVANGAGASFATSAVARAGAKLLNDHATSVSNEWLARNLLRMSIGYKMIANAWDEATDQEARAESAAEGAGLASAAEPQTTRQGPSPDGNHLPRAARAALDEILRERATAIHTWTQRHGSETGAMFMDPLYRIEEEIEPRKPRVDK